MKFTPALLTLSLLCSTALAVTPAERFDQLSAQAQTLLDRKDYVHAVAALEVIANEPEFAGQQDFPQRCYSLARAAASAGNPEQALAALKTAVDLGGTPTADEVAKEAEFASLQNDARFKDQIARLRKQQAMWQDDPALATAYKPVLSEDEKVAGLSKLWAEARFNFAFFERVPELDWDAHYMAYLPKVRAAATTEDYYRVLMQFLAPLKDGHTRVLVPAELRDRFYGITAVKTELIQGKIIVTEVSDPALVGVRAGDEVVAVNGRPAFEYAKAEVEPYVFGFTPQDRDAWEYGYWLLRGPVGEVHLVLRDAGGRTRSATVPRKHNNGPFGFLPEITKQTQFKMLPGKIAYLYIANFGDDAGIRTLRDNFTAISASDGFVIDLRDNGGGNDDYAHAILQVLADKPYKGSNWRTRDYKAAFRSWGRPIGWLRSGGGEHKPDPTMHYGKPVVVLTSARTYSAAEDFTSGFDGMRRGTIVGETTGGSTGNPMLMKLPGGGMAFICTKDDSYWNGHVFEGVGIEPQVRVSPTIADIRAGRDRGLETAVKLLREGH